MLARRERELTSYSSGPQLLGQTLFFSYYGSKVISQTLNLLNYVRSYERVQCDALRRNH